MDSLPLCLRWIRLHPIQSDASFVSTQSYGSWFQQRYTLEVHITIDKDKEFWYNARGITTLNELKKQGHHIEVYRYRTGLFPILYGSDEPELIDT